MRDLLNRSDLARYAGQFVWLELNFDAPENHAFFSKYGVGATPTFVIIEPHREDVAEIQPGAMSLTELTDFLERGTARVSADHQSNADAALKRGDSLRAARPGESVVAYQEALRIAPPNWQDRELAEASLVGALQSDKQYQQCAETAAADASRMARNSMFARTVETGMWCMVSSATSEWAAAVSPKLQSLAQEALSSSETVRDHRDEIYRTLMLLAVGRNDKEAAGKWGDRWLAELDAIKPATEEERSALDIARVENIQTYGDPARILPALIESERVMRTNYVASLRLAQTQLMANRYDDAIAAIDRGLARNPGAAGRAWLLEMKADAFTQQGKRDAAQRALRLALVAAQQIPNPNSRKRNIDGINQTLKSMASNQN